MPTTFYFLRHGQAIHNTDEFRKQGEKAHTNPIYQDTCLTEQGREQAQNARIALESMRFDEIYCSPLRRCRQTLLEAYPESEHRTVWVDDRILEQPYGRNIVDKRMEKPFILKDSPVQWDISRVSSTNPFNTTEEHRELEHIRTFTQDVRLKWPNGVVLVVAHQTWIRRWTRMFATETQVENGKWIVHTI